MISSKATLRKKFTCCNHPVSNQANIWTRFVNWKNHSIDSDNIDLHYIYSKPSLEDHIVSSQHWLSLYILRTIFEFHSYLSWVSMTLWSLEKAWSGHKNKRDAFKKVQGIGPQKITFFPRHWGHSKPRWVSVLTMTLPVELALQVRNKMNVIPFRHPSIKTWN